MGPDRMMPMAQISWQLIITSSGLALLTLVLLWVGPAPAQEGHQHDRVPNVMEYLDRLDRPERDQDQKPAQVIDALALKIRQVATRHAVPVVENPPLARAIHATVEVDADTARFSMTIENVPSEENPRTGRITALSVLAALRKLTSPLRIGT